MQIQIYLRTKQQAQIKQLEFFKQLLIQIKLLSYASNMQNNISQINTKKIEPQSENIAEHIINQNKKQLDQLINCHICYQKAKVATMCPYCSKLYCEMCIKRSLQNKQQCPNCRKSLKITTVANCSRFLNELTLLLEQLIQQKSLQEKCVQHNVIKNYYCQSCKISICCECNMFGTHKNHTIQQLKKIYEQKCEKIRSQLATIKKEMKNKQNLIKQMQQKNIELHKQKERRLAEIEQNSQFYRLKILNESSSQQKFLQQYGLMINQEILRIEQLELNLKKKLSATNNIYLSEINTNQQQDLRQLSQKQFINPNIEQKFNFIHQIIPEYTQSTYVIQNFTQRKKEKCVLYSPIIQNQGLQWRLKIYPNGNQSVEGTHLSVFLQLVSSIKKQNFYEYKIELINKKNKDLKMVREYNSNFEPSQCWGYNKYIKLQNLYNQGFIDQIADTIQIKYYIRQHSYRHVSSHKAIYIDLLDLELLKSEEQLKNLQEQLNNVL